LFQAGALPPAANCCCVPTVLGLAPAEGSEGFGGVFCASLVCDALEFDLPQGQRLAMLQDLPEEHPATPATAITASHRVHALRIESSLVQAVGKDRECRGLANSAQGDRGVLILEDGVRNATRGLFPSAYEVCRL
jgi:hypothetical protein